MPRSRLGDILPVAFFAPIPIPMTNRAAKSPCHDFAKAEPIGVAVRQQAVRKISPLRPKYWLRGSVRKAPLRRRIAGQFKPTSEDRECCFDNSIWIATHIKPAVRKMMAFTKPTIHSSAPVLLSIPNSFGKDKLAPLDPV